MNIMQHRYIKPQYTPEIIDQLHPCEIFVFGSNITGHHIGGAAKTAYNKFGAIWGKGTGIQGHSYAIPTMHGSVETIRPYVKEFIRFAAENKHLVFLVTKIGCGIAGFSDKDIAPLFAEAIFHDNIVLPKSFVSIIDKLKLSDKYSKFEDRERELQKQNPYMAGTLSHGIWERTQHFDLLWEYYDYCDWHKFFEKYSMENEFMRCTDVIDNQMHHQINKDCIFRLYWSAVFPANKLILIEQCHYYKGELMNPFRSNKKILWDYEKCWIDLCLKTPDKLASYLDIYINYGFENLCPNDGVPMSMKALLLNRWLNSKASTSNIELFINWYEETDYTNTSEHIVIDDLFDKGNLDFIFFWKHTENKEEISKACLSQWSKSYFTVDGIHYNCAEQYMMAEKARLMKDEYTRQRILSETDPHEIKKLGKEVQNFNEEVWRRHRMDIVIKGNFYKFMANKSLRDYLLSTGNKILVEASPYDTIWGIGMKEECAEIRNPRLWKGQNLLGFALMEVRSRLKKLYLKI